MTTLSTLEVQSQYPDAFNALPEPYQNDSCLEFFWDDSCELLFAYPRTESDKAAIGNIECVFFGDKWEVQTPID